MSAARPPSEPAPEAAMSNFGIWLRLLAATAALAAGVAALVIAIELVRSVLA